MIYYKGGGGQDLCHDGPVCGEKGWTQHGSTGCCHECPMGTTDLPPCHDSGSISRDIEGSCQSAPQGCQPVEPCPPQSRCDFGKPRRRVEVSHVQPTCPPPVKIHRRPLQQYRPPLHCEEPECCKPRRRVEQCPVEDDRPHIILHPLPPQRRGPCVPCCSPPVQHHRPVPVPLPPYPSQHQQKKVTLLPPCLQKK